MFRQKKRDSTGDCNLYASTTRERESGKKINRSPLTFALAPFPGFSRPQKTTPPAPGTESLHQQQRTGPLPLPLLPRPRSLNAAAQHKARRTNTGERNKQNKWFYPSNVRRGEWGLGTNNQHRNRSATCRNVRPTGILFAQGKKGVIFFGVDRPQQVVPSGKKKLKKTPGRECLPSGCWCSSSRRAMHHPPRPAVY